MKTKTFLLNDIVKIDYGNKFDLQKMTFDTPIINFISRTALNNGVSAKVDLIPGKTPYKEGCLTIALGGSIGATFYQNKPFYTGQNIAVLKFKENVPILAKLYLCQIIKFEVKNKFRAFGRELNKHIKTDFTINLPVNNENNPDWNYMNEYMQKLHHKNIESINYGNIYEIDLSIWKEFNLSDLFDTDNIRGKCPSINSLEDGDTEVISTTEINNGVIGKYDIEKAYKHKITVSFNGSCGFFSFHENYFNATSDVGILEEKFPLNKYNAMFLCTILNKLSYKYQYGRKLNGTRLKNEIILLPTKNGKPDWEFMEKYIKSLHYADII